MSILINKDTKVVTQGITGKTGQFHTEKCQEYANGKNCFVAGVNPKKAGESIFGIPIFGSIKEAAAETGATVSVIYVPPPGAAAAIWEAVEADLGELGDRFVGQRAGARDDTDASLAVDVTGHDADLDFVRRDQTGAVGAED